MSRVWELGEFKIYSSSQAEMCPTSETLHFRYALSGLFPSYDSITLLSVSSQNPHLPTDRTVVAMIYTIN